jgi:cobalamin biosynthesis protein CobT
MLQVKSAKHYVNGYKSGKMSSSRLYRVGLPPIDGGDWNSKVFKRRTQETNLLDTAVLVLVDWSGSMGGSKAEHAAKGAGLINEAFSKVLHIPLEILSFSCSGPEPTIAVIKSFNRNASSDEIADRFCQFLAHMSGNNDADSLLYAYSRILKRPEKRKIILVMSDGSPADGIGDPSYALKTVTKRIGDERMVELYGVGIMDRNVERFYPKWHVIDYGQSIEEGLITVLGKALT